MTTLKYTVIKNRTQYNAYCTALEELLAQSSRDKASKEEEELLTLLIETWDAAHQTVSDADPVQLLQGLMETHSMKATDLTTMLGVSKGLVSDILNYKKGFSKEVIRKLAVHFKVSQEAFNRPYALRGTQVVKRLVTAKKSLRKKAA